MVCAYDMYMRSAHLGRRRNRNALLLRAIFIFASAHAAGLPVFINMQLPPKGVLPKSVGATMTSDRR